MTDPLPDHGPTPTTPPSHDFHMALPGAGDRTVDRAAADARVTPTVAFLKYIF